MTKELKQI